VATSSSQGDAPVSEQGILGIELTKPGQGSTEPAARRGKARPQSGRTFAQTSAPISAATTRAEGLGCSLTISTALSPTNSRSPTA